MTPKKATGPPSTSRVRNKAGSVIGGSSTQPQSLVVVASGSAGSPFGIVCPNPSHEL